MKYSELINLEQYSLQDETVRWYNLAPDHLDIHAVTNQAWSRRQYDAFVKTVERMPETVFQKAQQFLVYHHNDSLCQLQEPKQEPLS